MSGEYSASSSGLPTSSSYESSSSVSPLANGLFTNGTPVLTNGTTMVNGYSGSTPSPPPAQQPLPTTTAGSAFMQLVPPITFACVEEGLFRSGQPSSLNLRFLSELNLKTIVWLAVEEPNEALLAFADDNELTIHHLGIAEGGNPWDPLTEQCVIDALHHIVDSRNYPLLISCGMGRHRTGTVVGCLRRLQRWNLASALEEYRRFTGSRRSRVVNELHIEAFQRDSIFLPPVGIRPSWLDGV